MQPAARVWWNDTDRHGWLTWAVAVGLVGAVLLAVLGLPPIGLHSPLRYLGGVCPLCGMTRAVRQLMLGNVTAALRYNPAAPLVLLGGGVVLARWTLGRLTQHWLDMSLRWTPRLVALTLLLVAVLWIRQQANADLLVHEH